MKLFNKYTLLVLLLISIGFNYYNIFIQDEAYTKEYEGKQRRRREKSIKRSNELNAKLQNTKLKL